MSSGEHKTFGGPTTGPKIRRIDYPWHPRPEHRGVLGFARWSANFLWNKPHNRPFVIAGAIAMTAGFFLSYGAEDTMKKKGESKHIKYHCSRCLWTDVPLSFPSVSSDGLWQNTTDRKLWSSVLLCRGFQTSMAL